MKTLLERGQIWERSQSEPFNNQGCVRGGDRLETAMVHEQSHGTHPSLKSPGYAVSFTPFPSREGTIGLSHTKWCCPAFGQHCLKGLGWVSCSWNSGVDLIRPVWNVPLLPFVERCNGVRLSNKGVTQYFPKWIPCEGRGITNLWYA